MKKHWAKYPKYQRGGGVTYDTDAQALFTASGATNAAQKLAISNFYTAVKATSGLYAKMKAWYFLFQGSASLNKWNGINPTDSDAAFRLAFNGTVTHGSGGITGNGTTGYANTFFAPSAQWTINSGSFGVGINTWTSSGYDMGCDDGSQTQQQYVIHVNSFADGNWYYNYGHNGGSRSVASTGAGFYAVNRGGTAFTTDAWKNGSKIGTTGVLACDGLSNDSMYIGANNNNGTPQFYSNRTYWFSYLASALSDADCSALNTAVAALKTALGI